MTGRFGWLPDLPDQRDFKLTLPKQSAIAGSVDLRKQMPPVYDQGQLGSCTANAIAAAFDFERGKQGLPFMTPSRLFIYYNERAKEHTIRSDAGAAIRDGIKSVAKKGVCPESEWPYVISRFSKKPSVKAFSDALANTSVKYLAVGQTAGDVMAALTGGYPVVIGFTVYASFDQIGSNGVMPMPAPNEKVLGGHAVVIAGYNFATKTFICRNSWGSAWGDAGYFYMPTAYVDGSNTSDFWAIELVK